MRWVIRQLLYHFTALILTASIIPGFSVGNTYENIAIATVALSVINVFIKPIVKILFLPLNMITLNLFSIIINIAVVFGLTKVVPTVTISSWYFSGISISGFVIPEFEFTIIYTYILVSVILTAIIAVLNWVTS
ncbi:phage holin family protein [Candidatus Gottesmanbacteria bacterium]|nr:phage holin family protein [Candidatus Gottesmanbacteria bacterium]